MAKNNKSSSKYHLITSNNRRFIVSFFISIFIYLFLIILILIYLVGSPYAKKVNKQQNAIEVSLVFHHNHDSFEAIQKNPLLNPSYLRGILPPEELLVIEYSMLKLQSYTTDDEAQREAINSRINTIQKSFNIQEESYQLTEEDKEKLSKKILLNLLNEFEREQHLKLVKLLRNKDYEYLKDILLFIHDDEYIIYNREKFQQIKEYLHDRENPITL